jgi:DNA polymerase-3 subunit gamma/tau
VKVAKGVIPLVVRASGGSVRDALSVLGQLLAGAGKDGVTYEVATALLGYTDGALLDEAVDALAARDGATLFNTVNRVVESGHDPRRFTQDFLERLRDLIIVGASKDSAAQILHEYPEDQLERMKNQASLIGAATLIRSADIAADGLTQMRGATAPRLILELICARILLPGSDDQGLLARVERLENGIAITAPVAKPLATEKSEPVVAKEKAVKEVSQPATITEVAPVPDQTPVKEPVAVKAAAPTPKPSGPVDIAALRKFWPEVIENVKKQRRLTWSLLSASAQVLSVDDKAITIGIVNSGARDSFIRSESDVILRKAFVEVVGLDLKVECIVDPSVNSSTTTPERTVEDPSDAAQLSGAELLAKELGAQVIKKFSNDV